MTAEQRKTGDGRRKTTASSRGKGKGTASKATSAARRKTGSGRGKTTGHVAGKAAGAAKKAATKSAKKEAARKTVTTQPKKSTGEPTRATARPAPRVSDPGWNPKIVVFACNWCSYAGADTAGVSRIQHQPHFRMIRVMCSGRIQPAFVLRAFEKGADGVLVSGCHFGDCHYIFGNERAVEQFDKTMKMVKLLGIEEGRLRLEWISAAEGVRFAQVINEFTDQVRALGPSPFALPARAEEVA
jgi:F420-non-reducing hydrogenase iron-sulfur subunit